MKLKPDETEMLLVGGSPVQLSGVQHAGDGELSLKEQVHSF